MSSDYFMEKSLLNHKGIDSFRKVGKQVIGIDRSLQKQLGGKDLQQSDEADALWLIWTMEASSFTIGCAHP